MAAPPVGYLLDTNILVHLIRGKAVSLAIDTAFHLSSQMARCAISVVTVGEMYSLARKWGWGPKKVERLNDLLNELVPININHPDTLRAYGELDDMSNRAGHPLGKNDVWIAATAKVSGMVLLTTDADFDLFHPAHLTRVRIDEKTGLALP